MEKEKTTQNHINLEQTISIPFAKSNGSTQSKGNQT